MKPREYCCCAVPVANAGIYAVLTEQLVLGILLGILSVATPSIVGAATPSFAPWIFGVVSFIAGAVQLLGFIGVAREKHRLFRSYMNLHCLLAVAVFAIGLTWTIISASRHSAAKSKCISEFFNTTQADLGTESEILCQIFPWVDVGIMGAFLLLLGALHAYFYAVISGYSVTQRDDHAKYSALSDSVNPNNAEGIPLNSRGSGDNIPYRDGHLRTDSMASMSDVMNQPMAQPRDGFSNNYGTSGYAQSGYPVRQGSYSDYVPQPNNAYTADPGPTPRYNQNIYSGPTTGLEKPMEAQYHPAEGSFGRKTPRAGDPYY